MKGVTLILIFLFSSEAAKIDVDLINEVVRSLVHFKNLPQNATRSMRKPATTHVTYMKNLYQRFNEEDGSDDGNVVRLIEPSVGKLDGEEVLVFDIDEFDRDEAILKAELHFNLRKHDVHAYRRSKQIKAKTLCVNEYCRETTLKRIRTEDEKTFKVVWDATKSVFETYHLDGKQVVVRISRSHQKMRPYSEMIRKSSPFLVIHSQVNHTLDTSIAVERTRKRRQVGEARNFYSYTAIPLEEDASVAQKRYDSDEEGLTEDVWRGFGEESTESPEEVAENDVRVVLLKDRTKCRKEGNLVDLKLFGWNEFIIEPKSIETSFCKGKCAVPFSKTSKASNHAMLQSIFATEPVCCAPSNLKSLNLLYRDEKGRTVLRNYQKMLIGACSCL